MVAEAHRDDLEPRREPEAGPEVEFVLGRLEEHVTEPQGERSPDHGELEVDDGPDRRERPTDQRAGAFHDRPRRPLGRTPGLLLDRGAAAVGVETPLPAAHTVAPVGLDDHVADPTRVAGTALQQAAAADDPAAHTRRDDHADEIVHTLGRAVPRLSRRERLGVGVDHRGQTGELLDLVADREPSPRRHVQRRHDPVGLHRAAASDAARCRRVRRRGDHSADQPGERLPHVARWRRHPVTDQHRTLSIHDAGGQLGSADVDGEVELGH
jgi:hypothetical protein